MTPERIHRAVDQWGCQQLQQLLNRVIYLTDRQAWEALSQCYTEDAVLSRPSDPENAIHGRANILASFKARTRRTAAHLLGNTLFTQKAEGRIEGISRVWLVSSTDSETFPVIADGEILVGTFVETFVREGRNGLLDAGMGVLKLSIKGCREIIILIFENVYTKKCGINEEMWNNFGAV